MLEHHRKIPSHMRAARIVEPGRVVVEEISTPEPGHGEVLVRVTGSGVCGSNAALWTGMPWIRYPRAPGEGGHEAWGVVAEIGSGVDGIEVGAAVTMVSYAAFAEYDIAPAKAVVPLPDALAHAPFPGEALGCAFNAFRRSAIQPGDDVAIIGVGFMGALLVRLAHQAGARVVAVSRRPFSLEVARRMGADHVVTLDPDGDVVGAVCSATGGELPDVVIEAVGKQWPLDLASRLVKTRGRLVVAGYHQDGPRQVDMQLWNWRGIDVINAHERELGVYVEGIRKALDATSSGRVNPSELVTHRYGLERLGDALTDVIDKPAGFLKAVVIP
jgi:threonine dehydrogenase-like Zn-dependent dehydrogenase